MERRGREREKKTVGKTEFITGACDTLFSQIEGGREEEIERAGRKREKKCSIYVWCLSDVGRWLVVWLQSQPVQERSEPPFSSLQTQMGTHVQGGAEGRGKGER